MVDAQQKLDETIDKMAKSCREMHAIRNNRMYLRQSHIGPLLAVERAANDVVAASREERWPVDSEIEDDN